MPERPHLSQSIVSSEPILSWIWRYLRRYRGRVAALVTLSCLEVLLRMLSPWPLKAVVDHVLGSAPLPPIVETLLAPFAVLTSRIEGKREQLLVAVVGSGLAVQLLHQFVMMFHSRLTSGTGHRMVRDLRERVFAHLQP